MPELARLYGDGAPVQMAFVDVTADEARRGCTFNVELPRRARCPRCAGAGEVDGDDCEGCGGDGLVRETELVTVTVPPDTAPGTVLTLRGEGDDHRDPAEGRGDRRVGVRVDGVFQPAGPPGRPTQPTPNLWIAIAIAIGVLAVAATLLLLRSG